MLCPYCYGPISRIRGLGKNQPKPTDKKLYRCLNCGADFTTKPEPTPKSHLRTDGWSPRLQAVWPRTSG